MFWKVFRAGGAVQGELALPADMLMKEEFSLAPQAVDGAQGRGLDLVGAEQAALDEEPGLLESPQLVR